MDEGSLQAAVKLVTQNATLTTSLALILCEAGILRPERAEALAEQIHAMAMICIQHGADATEFLDAAAYLDRYAEAARAGGPSRG